MVRVFCPAEYKDATRTFVRDTPAPLPSSSRHGQSCRKMDRTRGAPPCQEFPPYKVDCGCRVVSLSYFRFGLSSAGPDSSSGRFSSGCACTSITTVSSNPWFNRAPEPPERTTHREIGLTSLATQVPEHPLRSKIVAVEPRKRRRIFTRAQRSQLGSEAAVIAQARECPYPGVASTVWIGEIARAATNPLRYAIVCPVAFCPQIVIRQTSQIWVVCRMRLNAYPGAA